MEPGADLETEPAHGLPDREAAADTASGAVECRDEAVAGRRDLATAKALDLLARCPVVPLEHLAPRAVAELGGPLGRPHDVRKQHRREHAVVVLDCRRS